MCLICVEFAKGKLTTREARRALGEMAVALDRTHVEELKRTLAEADAKQNEEDDDAD
ncbi:MAG: hypothetical protein IT381_13295 [Deltaproteobacteria bacterium]|nr:hypothetical protein [Deltaproteobacteria bacterium]